MGRTLTYSKLTHPNTTANRYKHRATWDLGAIHSIVNASPVVHVSFSPDPADPFPAILPMIGQMGSFEHPSSSIDEPLDCYLHGYVSSRIMNLARKTESEEGLPVCVCATSVDGLILSLTPNSHSYNYRSAILYGHATLVTDVEEKLWAMELITNSVVQDRWANSRTPPDKAEMSSTVILRVKVVSGSGKIRDGGVGDEKKDTTRDDVTGRVWTGVVPVYQVYGEPIPDPKNRVPEVPEHILKHTKEQNEKNEQYAKDAAFIMLPKEEIHD